jgi:hypothetical protein
MGRLKMLFAKKAMKVKVPRALKVSRGRPKIDPRKKSRHYQLSIQGDLIDFLEAAGLKSKSAFVSLAIRTMMEFKKYRSLPYDKCLDCGCDMTAPLNPMDGAKTYVDEDGKVLDVFVQCEGCGGRAGHRQYDPKNHGLESE